MRRQPVAGSGHDLLPDIPGRGGGDLPMSHSTSHRRDLCRLVAPIVALVFAAGCAGGDDSAADAGAEPAAVAPSSSAPTTIADDPHDQDDDDHDDDAVGPDLPDLPDLSPIDDARRAELIAELTSAFERARSGPAQIDLEMDEEGTESAASIRVDPPRGLLDSSWVQLTRRGGEITTLYVVIDGRYFLKSTASAEAAALLDYYEGGASTADELVENVFTAFGRIGPTLDRLLLFVEELPYEVGTVAEGGAVRTVVVIDVDDVVDLFAETGLETTGTVHTHEPVRLDFIIDDGTLAGIDASGTQFHDGEAIELTASLRYRSIDAFDLEIPPLEE
jgi:hypothetical protein